MFLYVTKRQQYIKYINCLKNYVYCAYVINITYAVIFYKYICAKIRKHNKQS